MSLTAGQRVALWPEGSPERARDLAAADVHLRVFPASTVPAATVVILPGGGYGMVSENEADPVARRFNRDGFTGIVATYRVAPFTQSSTADRPIPLRDAARAMRLVRANAPAWGVDPAQIAVLGFSAGGHLAGSLATAATDTPPDDDPALDAISPRPDAVMLAYPVASLRSPHGHAGSAANLLGPDATDADRARWSIDERIDAHTPPAFIWHTGEDAAVPVENALLLAASLRRHDVPFELHVYPTGQHGLNLASGEPGAQSWPALATTWLRQTLG